MQRKDIKEINNRISSAIKIHRLLNRPCISKIGSKDSNKNDGTQKTIQTYSMKNVFSKTYATGILACSFSINLVSKKSFYVHFFLWYDWLKKDCFAKQLKTSVDVV